MLFRSGSQWLYDTNGAYVAFTPRSGSDVLVATLDFSANTATSAQGMDENIGSPPIHLGYASGDLVVTAQMWGGSENNGEFGISGGHFMTTAGTWDSIFDGAVAVSGLNNGVACQDGHTGTGYILYSEENIHTRFAAASPHADNAENFICAVFDAASSQWSYDTNGNHVVFTPLDTDLLVAAVDFTNDLISSGAGVSGTVGGIAFGYSTGDLSFTANQWGGSDNAGEFGIAGSFFELNDSAEAFDVLPLFVSLCDCQDVFRVKVRHVSLFANVLNRIDEQNLALLIGRFA
mgnify:CR=1 FL=1